MPALEFEDLRHALFLGLDLGQAADYTAFTVVQQIPANQPSADRQTCHYSIRWLERFDRGTPYPTMIDKLKAKFETNTLAHGKLAVDYTGVGRPVVDLLRLAHLPVELHPIVITAGLKSTRDADGVHHVPKKDLVSTMQVLMQSGLLKVPPSLPLADVFLKELGDFRARITLAGSETFGAWRESKHDDLVLAVSLACWLAEENRPLTGEWYST